MNEIKRVAVLGAGTMGHGIAQVCAQAGYSVVLRDIDQAVLDRALENIRASLERLVAKGKIQAADREQTLGRVATTTDLQKAVAAADLVIEAIPERMDWKKDTFRQLEQSAPKAAVLASNTSSLSISEIASATKSPERVIGMHFFNPVPVMQLVEIVRGKQTSDETLASARGVTNRIGKQSIVVKDFPGFATSRLGVALGAEAIRMLEDGVASAEDIDLAMELGYRHPMGPLRLTDLVGLDVRLSILEHLYKEVGEQFRPPELLRKMVQAGKLGRKTGEGFYKY